MSYSITTMAVAKNVNAVRFTSDGSRVNIAICIFNTIMNFYGLLLFCIFIYKAQLKQFIHIFNYKCGLILFCMKRF